MITLHCQYAGFPGSDWDAELTFKKTDSRLRVHGIATGMGDTYRLRRSSRLQPKLPFWLSCAHFLISLEPDWALPAEAASSIVAKGSSGIQADILAICWTRVDDDKEVCFGRDVLQLTKGTIERLTEQLGSVRSKGIEWNTLFTHIAEAQTALGLDSNPAKFLNSMLGSKDVDVKIVISELETEVEDWEGRLDSHIELHKEAFEPIVTKVLGSFPSAGLIAKQSYSERRSALLRFLASEMIRKGVSPKNISLQKWKMPF